MAHTACSDPATPLSLPSTFVVVPVMCKWQLPVLRDASHTGVQHHPATAWPSMSRTHSSSSTYTLALLLIGTGLSGLCCWQPSFPLCLFTKQPTGVSSRARNRTQCYWHQDTHYTLKPADLVQKHALTAFPAPYLAYTSHTRPPASHHLPSCLMLPKPSSVPHISVHLFPYTQH